MASILQRFLRRGRDWEPRSPSRNLTGVRREQRLRTYTEPCRIRTKVLPGLEGCDVLVPVDPSTMPPVGKLSSRIKLDVADLKEATEVIVRNHYLHRGRTMGQLPYWVLLDNQRVGVLLYAYPRMSVKFHGYGPMELLELARMWLDPSIQGLRVTDSSGREHSFSVATCAVGKSLRRVRQDWHGKYPHLPDILAVVSWADQEHHEGTIYSAANFHRLGTSGGSLHGHTYRRNGGHDQLNPDYKHLKTTFLYEYRRPLRQREKDEAELGWALRRENRVRRNQLPEGQCRLPFEPYPVARNVSPGDLRIVERDPSIADIPQPLEVAFEVHGT
jgi:hypothetical protein